MDATVSTASDGVEDNDGDMTQRDSRTQLRNRLPLRGGGGVWSVYIVILVLLEGWPLRSGVVQMGTWTLLGKLRLV